jgi:hypothetical protein
LRALLRVPCCVQQLFAVCVCVCVCVCVFCVGVVVSLVSCVSSVSCVVCWGFLAHLHSITLTAVASCSPVVGARVHSGFMLRLPGAWLVPSGRRVVVLQLLHSLDRLLLLMCRIIGLAVTSHSSCQLLQF